MGDRPPGPFAYHQATAEAIDASALAVATSKNAVVAVDPTVRTASSRAATSVDGDLTDPIQTPVQLLLPDIANMGKLATVAAEAIYLFAEAVRAFDTGVAQLNSEYAGLVAERDNLAASRTGVADRAPLPTVGTVYGDRLASLENRYYAELLPTLEAGARLTKSFLDGRIAEDNVQLLWALSGSRQVLSGLPHFFPEFNLPAVNPETEIISAMSNPELADELVELAPPALLTKLLNDAAIRPELRSMIRDLRPDALAKFSADWRLENAGRSPNTQCLPGSSGNLVGPDGRIYQVQVPGQRPGTNAYPDGDTIPDDGPGSGWATVDGRFGTVENGEPVTGLERALWALSGTKYPGDSYSIGTEQEQYVTVTPDGRVVLNPELTVLEETSEGLPPTLPPGEYYRSVNVGDFAEQVVNTTEGLVTGENVEANRYATSYVTFQENADGTLRAVIDINQVRTDGSNVFIDSTHATLNPDGIVNPVG